MSEGNEYNPFAGATRCDCNKEKPKVFTSIIPSAYDEEEEDYHCEWCRFVRKFGMVDELENIKKKTVKPISQKEPDYSPTGMEVGSWFVRDYEEYANMRAFFGAIITYARELLNITIAEIAKKLDLPEYIIRNLEKGEVHIKFETDKLSVASVMPVISKDEMNITIEKTREVRWWEEKQDCEIERVIHNFLLEQKGIRK